MADNQLQINIGADTRNLEQGLDRAQAEITDFDKSLKISGTGLVDFENKAKQGGKAAGDFGNKLKEVPAASSKATFALTNLGRVASDAPFGFIAIQNNIDPLIQSFAAVRKESGSVGGALKALGSSLAGPGGLLLGFTLISSAITVAIQKYGSLGNAIDAIFGKTDTLNKEVVDAAKSYEKFNEQLKSTADIQAQASGSQQGEISRVQALASIVSDQTRSYNERNNALKQLKEINKTYFGDIDLESTKLATLKGRVDDYTRATIQSAITKGFETEIGAVNVELNKQVNLLAKLKERLDDARRAPVRIVGAAATVDTRDIIAAEQAFNKQAGVVKELESRTKELNSAIGESIGRYNSLTAPINAAADATAKQAQADKEAASASKLQQVERRKQAAEQTKLNAATKAYNDLVAREQLFKARLQTVDIPQSQLPQLTIPATISPVVPQSTIDSFNAFAAKQKEVFNADVIQQYSNIFNDTLAPAIDAAFGALANGTSVIDAVKNSLKGLLAQLAANAAKALLLKAALNFIPGAGIVGAGGGGGLGGILSGLLGGGGGLGRLAGAAAPSFGGVSSFAGGMQLSGQVVFRQRGADLVGVLNTQNGRINRVG